MLGTPTRRRVLGAAGFAAAIAFAGSTACADHRRSRCGDARTRVRVAPAYVDPHYDQPAVILEDPRSFYDPAPQVVYTDRVVRRRPSCRCREYRHDRRYDRARRCDEGRRVYTGHRGHRRARVAVGAHARRGHHRRGISVRVGRDRRGPLRRGGAHGRRRW